MKILKFLLISMTQVILFSSFNNNSFKTNKNVLNQLKITNDSIWVYKTEILSIIPYTSNETIETNSETKGVSYISYHEINLLKGHIENFYFNNEKKEWSSIKFPFQEMKVIDKERVDFITYSNGNEKYRISFINNPSNKSFVYKTSDKEIFYYPKSTFISNEDLNVENLKTD